MPRVLVPRILVPRILVPRILVPDSAWKDPNLDSSKLSRHHKLRVIHENWHGAQFTKAVR